MPAELLKRIQAVTNKRARFVLDRIIANGQVTSEEISQAGYNHPPRAARDVRELGIALKTIRVRHSDGRSIGGYVLDLEKTLTGRRGRRLMPKSVRDALLQAAAHRCQICGADKNLQVDHRIPYEVAGESQSGVSESYQILDGVCNRKKSWSCEHCRNWVELKDLDICRSCYWANPEGYSHVAMQQERRADLVWIGEEVGRFDQIRSAARRDGRTLPEQIKQMLSSTRKP
ncbi:MAG TPA: hypothetical protein VGD64_00740 [Acidisarcina sp.]